MRPLRLELEAIGPFLDPVVIDFDAFDDQSLFLISGPTGSGKSFLFDAMTYALYAKTGSVRTALSSDFADAQAVPVISFSFRTGGGVYRVRRELPHQKPKKDGGFREVPEKQMLEALQSWPDGEAKCLAEKKTDVNRRCEEILQLSVEQFSQVVLIPQGEFRRLLLEPDKREELLERLFQSDRFKRVEHSLHQRQKDRMQAIAKVGTAVDTLREQAEPLIPDALREGDDAERDPDRRMGGALTHWQGLLPGFAERRERAEQEHAKCARELEQAEALRKRFDEWKQVLKEIAELDDREEREIAALRVQISAHREAAKGMPMLRAAKQSAERLQETGHDRRELAGKLEQAEQELKRLVAPGRDAAALPERVERGTAFLQRLDDAARTGAERLDAERAVQKTSKEAGQARKAWTKLRDRRENQLAGELAAELNPGEPCPVCGSTEHPHPAAHEGVEADRAAVLEAEKRAAALEKRLHQEEGALEAAGAGLSAAEKELARFPEEWPRTEKKFEPLLKQWSKDLAAAERTAARRVELEALLKETQGRAAQLDKQHAALERERETAEKTWKQHLAESSFDTGQALQEAFRGEDWLEQAQPKVDEFEDRRKACLAVRAQLEKALKGKSEPETAALVEREAASRATWQDAVGEERDLQSRITGLSRIIETIREKEAGVAAEREELKVLDRLVRQVRGMDVPKISLNRFFLGQRLEEVLIQATRRLQLLSHGKFELRRSTEARHASAKAGLDLKVLDTHTGKERDATTLSGGEMFLTSLALALGLADVVQARSQTFSVDALFIDEGFGSLDDESLQMALQVLNDLRKGRMVGIISHVVELKRQVSNRIEVQRDTLGSGVKLISDDG